MTMNQKTKTLNPLQMQLLMQTNMVTKMMNLILAIRMRMQQQSTMNLRIKTIVKKGKMVLNYTMKMLCQGIKLIRLNYQPPRKQRGKEKEGEIDLIKNNIVSLEMRQLKIILCQKCLHSLQNKIRFRLMRRLQKQKKNFIPMSKRFLIRYLINVQKTN